ncbi:hypothetical protein BgAZ_206160 [Babesia gibsoni]|uniref:Uncharacterized protein n=1 Tax=Babesia gibsoni TaxID=33632 RepID=A0AAD8LT82_BABGI|nr:hypothetical protein BgAZ_206160 [Babesia gibsoni]
MSALLASVERDDGHEELLTSLAKEFKELDSADKPVYKRVVMGVIANMEKIEALDASDKLDSNSLAMLQDIAGYGRFSYPWKLTKMVLIVTWNHLFDELYEKETVNGAYCYDEQQYHDEKRKLLTTLSRLEQPPITLQRFTEIPLKQPYKNVWKLFHAYCKVLTVGTVPEDCTLPCSEEFSEAMQKALENYSVWEQDIVLNEEPVWDDRLCNEDLEDGSVGEEDSGKRSLDLLI